MLRRSFLRTLAAAPAAGLILGRRAEAALPKAKITKVNIYEPPNVNRLFNQSNMLVTVETDIGVTGIGEGGSRDTLEQCGGDLIGQNPFQIDRLWQLMYVAWFYPPGREKIHAQGALDMALWDIKGKVLQLPFHQLLGGSARDYCECYATASGIPGTGGGGGRGGVDPFGLPGGGALPANDSDLFDHTRAAAKAAMAAGYRAYRMDASITGGNPTPDVPFNTHEQVRRVTQACKAAREGVGKGDFNIDFHQKFDFADAMRCCRAIEQYEPYLVEDPVRTEHFLEDIPKLRQMTSCPLAAGEEWGDRWDFNKLVENHDIDYIRVPLPNTGGITEMVKISALCETHSVGIVPHGTGPVSTAALVGCLSTFSGPVLLEYNFAGRPIPYLPECLDFKNGKAYTNDRPGLGVTLDLKQIKLVGEVTQAQRRSMYKRPDGSITHW